MDRLLNIIQRSRYWNSLKLSIVKICHSRECNIPYEHQHPDFYELVVVWEGHAVHLFDGEAIPINAGNVFLVPPRVKHCYLKPGPLGIYNIVFGEEMLQYFQDDLMGLHGFQLLSQTPSLMRCSGGTLRLDAAFFPEVVKLVEEMDVHQRNLRPGIRTLLFSNFLRLMLLVSDHCVPDESRGGLTHALPLSRLLAALDSRYGENWSLKSMTELVHMSDSHFRHQFKQMTGLAPVEYLLKLRLQKAAALLLVPELTIGMVAARCGFEDSNYFSRQFRREFHRSPSQFRQSGALEQLSSEIFSKKLLNR